MTDSTLPSENITATIVGFKAGCVVVRLADGSEVLCRGGKELHRTFGCLSLPIERQVRITSQGDGKGNRPRIVEVLPS